MDNCSSAGNSASGTKLLDFNWRDENVTHVDIYGLGLVINAMGILSEPATLPTEEINCYNFSVGNPYKKEFYSPRYPAKYPANADCILIVKGIDFKERLG